jgi:hypothetical protein
MALFSAERAQAQVREVARTTSSGVVGLARLGFAAKGLVYIIIGGLAAQAALGRGGRTTDSQGALSSILGQPFGRVLLAVVACGLAGYALWRFVQAALDPERKGGGVKGSAARAGYALSGVIHTGLAIEAVRMVLRGGGGSEDGGESADHWAEMVLGQPFGPYLLGLVGAGITAFGLQQLYRAATAQLDRRLDLTGMGSGAREWTIRFGRFGLAARGVVFSVIGLLLVQAAIQLDPQDAVGLAGALRTLRQQSHGPWLLGGVAFGLVGYGLFELVRARFRRIDPV